MLGLDSPDGGSATIIGLGPDDYLASSAPIKVMIHQSSPEVAKFVFDAARAVGGIIAEWPSTGTFLYPWEDDEPDVREPARPATVFAPPFVMSDAVPRGWPEPVPVASSDELAQLLRD